MWRLILRIFEKMACHHEWQKEIERDVNDGWGGRYTSYTYVCKKCGKFKRWKSS